MGLDAKKELKNPQHVFDKQACCFFLSLSTPAEQTKTSLLRILSHGVKSREKSPEERGSPEKKISSVKNSVKCTTVLKDRLTQQEALGRAADNISPDMFGMNSASFEETLCIPTTAQRRCRKLDAQEDIVTRSLQLQPHSCQCQSRFTAA